jgi:hypothetical protein
MTKDKIIDYWEAYMGIVRERKGAWKSHKYLYHVTKLPALEEMFQFGGLLSRHNYLSFKLLTLSNNYFNGDHNQLEYTKAFESIRWKHVNKLGEYPTSEKTKQYAMAECIRENVFPIEWVRNLCFQ